MRGGKSFHIEDNTHEIFNNIYYSVTFIRKRSMENVSSNIKPVNRDNYIKL